MKNIDKTLRSLKGEVKKLAKLEDELRMFSGVSKLGFNLGNENALFQKSKNYSIWK